MQPLFSPSPQPLCLFKSSALFFPPPSPLKMVASSHLCSVLQIYFGPVPVSTAAHSSCRPYPPLCCPPLTLPLLPLYTGLNNFLPGHLLLSLLIPASLLVRQFSPCRLSSFCLHCLPLLPPCSVCLSLLSRSFGRYIFSRGSLHFGITLRAGVHQCRAVRTQPERLRGGYCHCGTIITSAVRQTAVCPHICMHTRTHTYIYIDSCEVSRTVIACLNLLLHGGIYWHCCFCTTSCHVSAFHFWCQQRQTYEQLKRELSGL